MVRFSYICKLGFEKLGLHLHACSPMTAAISLQSQEFSKM